LIGVFLPQSFPSRERTATAQSHPTKAHSRTAAGTQWYNFACIYSVASSKIADKKQEYADRAMELLGTAVEQGFNDAAHIAEDSDLDPLRERDDFKKLLAELNEREMTTKQQ